MRFTCRTYLLTRTWFDYMSGRQDVL